MYKIIQADCEEELKHDTLKKIGFAQEIDLTFLDPPFNQGKQYAKHNDNMKEEDYWNWMERILARIYTLTAKGGAMYFMQREKNAEYVLRALRKTGWNFQNLIIWKKTTSAIPSNIRFGKHYQIIAFATKGKRPRVFNRLRIDPPLPEHYKYERKKGMYVTDVWTDIRELTSGYFAGDETLRSSDGKRLHKQQSPIELLLRIILSSTNPDDLILDPFAGTGTTGVVGEQLKRNSILIELDPKNVSAIQDRVSAIRKADRISKFREDYKYTEDLSEIWPALSENDIDYVKPLQEELDYPFC